MNQERFVPQMASDFSAVPRLRALLRGKRAVVLTGAGCSTASGIPDYRGPETIKKERKPVLYQHFVKSEEARRSYWARSAVGWPLIRGAAPNEAHRCLAQMEAAGQVTGVITQNVDGLHQAGGARRVLELHGALSRVICLECKERYCRDAVQKRLLGANPGWQEVCRAREIAPDGDMEVPEVPVTFAVPGCERCGGLLKPDVVFFGENVAKPVVAEAWAMVEEADVLLVVGSSLTVFSGYRFVRGAEKLGKPVAIVNLGPTRGDEHAAVRVQAKVCEALAALSG